MSEEIQKLIDQYGTMFNSHFPMYPLGELDEGELREILKDCIEQKKTVYQLGYLPDPSENLNIFY